MLTTSIIMNNQNKTKHPLYERWAAMKQRCNNSNHHAYENYGGRGITVCEQWSTNFWNYVEYVTNLPNSMNSGYTIDRIQNSIGYKPGNIRWATNSTQSINSRKNKNNSSGYTGIYFRPSTEEYEVSISHNKIRKRLGNFKTITEAINKYNAYVIENSLPHKLQ